MVKLFPLPKQVVVIPKWHGQPGDAATPAVPACQNRLDVLNPYKQTIFLLLAECAETLR
jgi:hypothetical protein